MEEKRAQDNILEHGEDTPFDSGDISQTRSLSDFTDEAVFDADAPGAKPRFPRWGLILALLLITAGALTFFLWKGCGPTPADATAQPAATAQPLPELPEDFHGLEMWTLDVDQGDSIFLRGPSGATMLVDGGPGGSFGKIHRFLQKQEVTRLDVVVCSHLHADHIGSIKEIIDHYQVGVLYLPPFDIESSAYANILRALDENNVPAQAVSASIQPLPVWDDECEVYALSPYEVKYDDENDTSIILRVAYGNTAVLLMGDATELSERLAIKALPNHLFHAQVLKVGHHGSNTSTGDKLLKTVKPELAVISVGRDNDYGLPNENTLFRLNTYGIRVLRTDEVGTVLIALDGERAWVVE